MTERTRRDRQRAERYELIVRSARELAEAEGWAAVTTRRLAERIEYSQPVLYGHFPGGKDAIVGAVARQGFVELVAQQRDRLAGVTASRERLAAVAAAYLAYAAEHPATYAAMFDLASDLPFAAADTPAVLHEGFAVLRDALGAVTGDADLDLRTELLWSSLHGLVGLARAGRLPPRTDGKRLTLLLARWT